MSKPTESIEIASKWPGKCSNCKASHERGDLVFWKNGVKGVRCVKCGPHPTEKQGTSDELEKMMRKLAEAQQKAAESSSNSSSEYFDKQRDYMQSSDGSSQMGYGGMYGQAPPEENDDLRKAYPENLKVGHSLAYHPEGLYLAIAKQLHNKDCNCFACEGYSIAEAIIVSMPKRITKTDFPLVSIKAGLAYDVRLTLRLGNTTKFARMMVPIECIKYEMIGGNHWFYVIAKAPRDIEESNSVPYVVIQWYDGSKTVMAFEAEQVIPPVFQQNMEEVPRFSIHSQTPGSYMTGDGVYTIGTAYTIDYNTKSLTPVVGDVNEKTKCECGTCVISNMLFEKKTSGLRVSSFRKNDYSAMSSVLMMYAEDDGKDENVAVSGSMETEAYTLLSNFGRVWTTIPDFISATKSKATEQQQEKPKEAMQLATQQQGNIDLSGAAATLIAALQASAVPEEKVRQIVLETVSAELSKLPPKRHKIKFNESSEVEFEGTMHSMATEIMEAIVAGFHNIMIVGPAGSGKTYLFSQVATLLKKQMKWDDNDFMASMSCAPGQTESMFIGRMIPSLTTGLESYHGTNLTRLYAKENGGAFLFDEISNSEPTVMNLVNSMIALDGHVTLPDGRVLVRPTNMVIFAADNTWGQGGDRMYIRNQLDAATLDRFTGAKFFMDYDTKLESSLCPEKEVYEAVLGLRKRVGELKLRRIVSTRAFAAAQRMSANGTKVKDILKRLTIDWSENDRKSVGV